MREQDIKLATLLGWQNISGGEFPVGQLESTQWKPVPRFSTESAPALDLIETVFPWPMFYVSIRRTDTGNWRCDIDLHGGDGPVVSASARTIPLAICAAAAQCAEAFLAASSRAGEGHE